MSRTYAEQVLVKIYFASPLRLQLTLLRGVTHISNAHRLKCVYQALDSIFSFDLLTVMKNTQNIHILEFVASDKFDVGHYGSNNDSGVLSKAKIGELIETNGVKLPEPKTWCLQLWSSAILFDWRRNFPPQNMADLRGGSRVRQVRQAPKTNFAFLSFKCHKFKAYVLDPALLTTV